MDRGETGCERGLPEIHEAEIGEKRKGKKGRKENRVQDIRKSAIVKN